MSTSTPEAAPIPIPSYATLQTVLLAVLDETIALSAGRDASASRDFGRGVAYAVTCIAEVIKAGVDTTGAVHS